MKNEFNDFFNRVGLMLAIDYGSRGGNAFFLTLFDNHPEVATMPWLMYCYSYIYTEYGKKENLDSKHAHRLVTSTGYFRYIYNEPNEITIKEIEKWGGSPYAIKNRDQIRQCFDELVLEEEKISRKKLICAMFYSYVQSLGVDINKFKYILMSDAISLRTESPQRGFSGKITELAHKDFENFRLINLHRDLRAQFASCRHQFINQNLNMYGLRIGNAGIRLSELLRMNFKIENFCFHYSPSVF